MLRCWHVGWLGSLVLMDGCWFLCFERAALGGLTASRGLTALLCWLGLVLRSAPLYLQGSLSWSSAICVDCDVLPQLRCAAAVRQTGVREHDRCCDTAAVCVALKCVSFSPVFLACAGFKPPVPLPKQAQRVFQKI